MGCNCGKNRIGGRSAGPGSRSATLGYEVTYPDGSVSDPIFLSLPEAKAEIRSWGGGTIRRIVRPPAP